MNSKLLLAFVIGSSYLPVFSHWFGLRKFLKDDVAYKGKSPAFKFDIFAKYILISTFYFGLLNLLITYLRMKYKFNIHSIYFIYSLISGVFIVSHNLYFKFLWDSYTFKSNMDKVMYGVRNILKHIIVFNFILKGLQLYLTSSHKFKDYVLSFVIGSSILVYMMWVLSLRRLDMDYYNFSGYNYFILAPLYFGIMNVISFYLAKKTGASDLTRLLVTSVISSLIVINLVYRYKLYNWKDKNKKYKYPLMSITGHLITYFIIIYVLERNIKSRR